jgi:hypothetical protein
MSSNVVDDKAEETSRRPLAFANRFIEAELVRSARDYVVEDGVVVNLSSEPVVSRGVLPGILPPWRSTMLRGARIERAECLAVISVSRRMNLGGLPLLGWDWYGDRNQKFSRETPLYISPQDTIGQVSVDPHVFTNEARDERAAEAFTLKLNLWWSPPETDCAIHNEHPFLELHTQIHGVGRMQKFLQREASTRYEDVVMAPGMTHEPFARVAGLQRWEYPWHRYYADTDCIWLAIELHPVTFAAP